MRKLKNPSIGRRLTKEERCKHLMDKGFTYDFETGIITSHVGNVLKGRSSRDYLSITCVEPDFIFSVRQHDFAWYYHYGKVADKIEFIDGDKTNVKISNLKETTHRGHCEKHIGKGYTFNKQNNKWKAQITINGKLKCLGHFETSEEARKAYLEGKKLYHNTTVKNDKDKVNS